MNRSEIERLSDEIIGEAVLSLLRGHGPVNSQALIVALGNLEAQEADPQRCEVIRSVIAEIHQMVASRGKQHGREQARKDNVLQLFGNRAQQSAKKIH